MTEEIYLNLENEPSMSEMDTVNVRLNLPEEKKDKVENRTSSAKNTPRNNEEPKRIRENRQNREDGRIEDREHRRFRRNRTLQDLIRILILNQLLGGNFRPPRPRPPFPGGPGPGPRPPFPGGPGPNPRPPMRPREIYGDM